MTNQVGQDNFGFFCDGVFLYILYYEEFPQYRLTRKYLETKYTPMKNLIKLSGNPNLKLTMINDRDGMERFI